MTEAAKSENSKSESEMGLLPANQVRNQGYYSQITIETTTLLCHPGEGSTTVLQLDSK